MRRMLFLSLCVLSACSNQPETVEKDAEFYYSLAVNNYFEKNAQAALLELEQCFVQDANFPPAHNLAGLIHMGRLNYAEALQHFEKALAAEPGFLDARANLGALHVAMRSWQQAIDVLTPLLGEARYGTPYIVENNLGWAYFNLGKLRDAEEHLKRALFLNKEMCLAYNNIGLVYVEMRRNDDAQDAFDAAITRCPEYVDPYFHSASLFEASGNIQESAKRYQKCGKIGGEGLYGRRCKKKLQSMR